MARSSPRRTGLRWWSSDPSTRRDSACSRVTPIASLTPLVTPKGTPSPTPVTPQEVTPSQALDTPAQAYEGPVMHSHAKLLQQEVHAFLSWLHTNIDENFILPKCFTLVVLRYTHEEKKLDQTTKRNSHNFWFPKAMKVTEHILERLWSLVSTTRNSLQFGGSKKTLWLI
jgi:hypothetical protein